MADIRCLICNRMNDASAERCWYCNTLLPRQTGSLTQQEREKLAGLRKNNDPSGNDQPASPSEETPKSTQPVPNQEEVPDWLARVRKLKQQDVQSGNQEARDWIEEEQPAWLRKLAGGGQAQENVLSGDADGEKLKVEDRASEQLQNGETLPFKGDIFSEISESREPEPQSSDDQSFQTGGEPDNLKVDEGLVNEILEVLPGSQKKTETSFPIAIDDLPDWLADESSAGDQEEGPGKDTDNLAPAPERKLEKAHLPAWLASLRPIQSIIQGATQTRSESVKTDQGILAGIQGTLPGVKSPQPVKPSQTFISELRLSSIQRKNAELFRLLIHPEEDHFPEDLAGKTAAGEHKLLRVLVTLLVLLSALIPIFTTSYRGTTPELFSAEVVNVLGLIQALPANQPVLVSAHFEAGLAGELDWTSQPVLRHLVSRGIPLVLSSTNVAGFAILQEMVNTAASEEAGYVVENSVVDLGYLPGGTIGLGALVNDPMGALPFTTDIQPVGEVQVLQNISSLGDFSALIIVTDNPEVARSWVEQVEQAGSEVKTVVVASAQAAPMVQPYYDSGQIYGYISGLGGAASYELLRTAPGVASSRFQVYQVLLLAAALIIFAGGIVSLIKSPPSATAKKDKR